MNLNGKRIFIVCSDPGAAQAVVILQKELKAKGADVLIVARRSGKGFASEVEIEIYKRKEAYRYFYSIQKFVSHKKPNVIITGTSLKDDLERNYIKAGRLSNIPVLSFIDWWTNFKQRFIHSRTKELCIPDIICVIDKAALKMCIKELDNKTQIIVTGNPYFSQVIERMVKQKVGQKKLLLELGLDPERMTILYFAEPFYHRFNQFDIFAKVTSAISRVIESDAIKLNIIVKFHPNGQKPEIFKKYKDIIDSNLSKGCLSKLIFKEHDVGKLIESADYVWGMNTTPMLEAILRGKLVSSFLPGFNVSGIPFLKNAHFCPSADSYKEFPELIKNLLINKKFVQRAIKRQNRYKIPKENFAETICNIIDSQLIKEKLR